MSAGFILNNLREEFSRRCLIVRGFPPNTNQQVVNSIFQGQCRRIQQKDGTTWLILFHNPQQIGFFLYPGNVIGPGNVPLQVTQSTVSDIPDSWLQDDQNNQAGALSQGNPPQGYLAYPGQGNQGNTLFSPPPTSQGQYPHNSQNIPYFPGYGQQYNPPTGTPSKTPLGDGPQVVPTDPTSYKSSLEPTFYMNYPNVSMPGPQMRPPDHTSNQSSFEPTIYVNAPSMPMPGPISSAPPPYENHDFAPQVPPRIPARKSLGFQNEAGGGSGGVQSTSIGSVMRGSDDADSMIQRRQVTMGHGQHFDPMAQKHQMNPTLYQNYPSGVSMAQPVTSAPPPYETHSFNAPQLPSKSPSKLSPREARGGRQSSSVENLNKSSDSAPVSQIAKEETSDVISSIEVSSLPPNVTEDFITNFFENSKRSGGGEVEDVSYDEKTNTVIITFQDPAVVKSVLKKHENKALTMDEVQLKIDEYHPKTEESEDEVEVMAVKVTNLPPKISKEQIELFFESRKKSGSGSDDVDKVDYDKAAHFAIVWFKNSEVVTKVLEKHKTSPFMLNKQKVEVEEYRPAADEDESSSEEEEEGGGAIKVTKIPPETTKEEIHLFFENRKKSGGGEVENVEYDKSTQTAVIWFKEDDVVSRVLQKVPLLLRKKQIHVEEVRLDGQKVEKEADEESPGSPCTIEVSGFKDTTSKDNVEFYFDNNKRSGGGGVEEVKGEVEDGVLLITFENEETVKRVLEKTHKLDGVELTVKGYQPPKPIPMYPNRVLVKGLNPETSEDGIRNYLEAKSGEDVIDITYGQEEGTVLVTFEELKDFTKLEAACQKKPLEKWFLTVKRVPLSNCIIVSGFSEGISDSTLEYYFENEKRSGGGPVIDIKVNHEDCTCLVHFEDHTVCDNVCKRSHVVEKQNLTVQIYHECLGQPFNPEEGPRFKCPSPLVLRELSLRKMKFIYKSEEFKTALDKQAEMANGKIKWPQKPATELTVDCVLTKADKDCKNLAKTWETHMKDGLERILDVLHEEKICVLQELWQRVVDCIKQLNVSDPQKVAIVLEKGSFTVVLVGYEKFVEPLKKDLKQMISNMEEEIQRKKQQLIESKTLRHSEFLLLSFDHFKEELEKKFPGLKITTNLKERKFTFEGLFEDVTHAKISLLERCHLICEASAGKFSKYRRDYLWKREVKTRVSKMLKEKENMSCFEFKGDEVCLFAFSDDKAVEAAHLLKNEIAESPIEVPPESAYLLSSDKWEKQAKQIESMEQFESLLQLITLVDKKKILIVTFCSMVGLAREFVEDFLQANTIITDSKNVPPSHFKFMELHHQDKCQEISSRLREKQVQITKSQNKFSVKGTRAGVAEAMRNLDEILKKIQSKKHILQKPGIGKYLKSDNGKSTIRKIERQNKCYIHIGEEDPTAIAPQPTSFSGVMAEHKTKSGTFIKVHEGDLTALSVDVIVNGANSDLLHGGGLAAVLVKKGGIEIQKECTEHVQKNGKLTEGEIYCSKSGTLSCKMIVHACGPTWKGGQNQEKDCLMDCIQAALEETEKRGYRSIAVPALCTGIFGFPIKEATPVIVKAVKSFLKDKKDSKIKEIFLCDVKTNTVQCFSEALQQVYNGKVNIFKRNIHQASGPAQNLQGDVAKGHAPSENVQFQAGPISVKLIKGQIARSKVDVIVNTASKDLDLSQGLVSTSISRAGGDSIQQECKTKYPKGINFGEIAVTGGGKLGCKIVCHGALPQWDNGAGNSKNVLQTFLKSCLMESHKQNLSSIAFPAMGTGKLGYPRDMVAEEMCNSVLNFSKENLNTSLKKVLFVVYEKDTPAIKAFETEIKKQALKTRQKKGGRHAKFKEVDGFVMVPEEATSGAKQKEVVVDMGHVKLHMYQGDITLADVDAIVNGTDSDMDLSKGGVSRAIKFKLGEELQRQIEIQKKNMKKHGLAVTANGEKSQIPSKFIIHIDVSGGNYKKKMVEALNKVEEMKLKTVAFPAMGTGESYQSQSVEDFADQVFNALNKLHSNVKHLTEVHIIIFDQQMTQKFIMAMQQCFQSQDSKPKGWFTKLANYIPSGGGGGKPHGLHWNPVVEEKDASKATIIVYGEGHDIDTGINRLENSLEGDFDTKEFKDEIIKKLSKTQMKALYDLKDRFQIDVNIDKDKGMAFLHGTKDDISAASDVYHRIIREAERGLQEGLQAKLISDYVQWYFVDNSNGKNELIEYTGNINLKIEKAYRNQDKEVKFTDDGGTEFVINFKDMEEYPTVDKTDVTTVTRRDKIKDSTFEPPSEWSTMKDSDNLVVVPVDSGSTEYSSVIDRFHAKVGKREIVKLERIQNKMLYQQYVAKKKLLDSQNPKGTQNERELWHGTAPEAVNSINSLGFNRSYCGKNATAYGEGVYFAVDAGYSASDTYSRPDGQKHKRMYLCKVLTGEFTVGQSGMRVPPAKQGQQSHILYDSVVNNISSPAMFIIFNDTQGYPDYLITFK
nr:protein mono-ADP-ribosyltransferase PARP14 isoform X2 [Crassostrea gigas]